MSDEFEFGDELLDLQTMTRTFCKQASPESVVRETMASATGYDPVQWQRLGAELGLIGLSVSDAYGGSGVGLVYQAIVMEEFGASLFCGPVVGTICLALPALNAIADESAKADYLPGLVRGQSVATLATPLTKGEFDSTAVDVAATATADGWLLSGHVRQVPDGAAADLVLVPARTSAGLALFAVSGAEAGVTRTPLSTMDLTRRQADITLEFVPGRLIADERDAAAVCTHAVRTATVLLAVEQVGGSQRMLDTTVAYVRDRIQFGQSVGAYQAVKHRCANMLVALEQARSAAYHGVWALQGGGDEPRLATSLAAAVASESYIWIAKSAIQLHGGIGFTWDGTPQLYFKRATVDLLTLGTATQHIGHVAELVL